MQEVHKAAKDVAISSPPCSVCTLMAALIKLEHETQHTSEHVSTELPTPSPLANETRIIIVWLDFSFQQQIHDRLCQIAACSSFSQGRSVVKGSHVILFFNFL